MEERIVIHVDFDYFYAQCEQVRRPQLGAVPVVVCVYSDRGGDSGAVATANYIARKSGVKSGMPIAFAKSRLAGSPEAVFLPTDFGHYSDISQKAMDVMRGFADTFEYVGRDEAYLDVTERTEGDYDRATHLAQQLKNEVRRAVGITCSVGVTPNRLLSKIASDHKKPDGITIVRPEEAAKFLEPLQIRDIPGIGKKTERWFAKMGLATIGELRSLDIFTLHQQFGRKTGTYIHNAARGIDEEAVAEREPSVQYSKISTLSEDSIDYGFLAKNLDELCGQLHRTVTGNRRLFKSVGIQLVQSDLTQKSRSRMLRNPTSGIDEMKNTAKQLLREALPDQKKPVRRLGVKVSELSEVRGQSSMDGYF